MSNLWTRARDKAREAMNWLRYAEPAMLRARYTMIVGVLAAAGLTIPGVVDRWAGIGLAAFAIVAPWLQGKRTRADVWSQQTVDDLTALAGLFPGLVDRAKDLLGKGISLDIVRAQLEQLAIAVDEPGAHAAEH